MSRYYYYIIIINIIIIIIFIIKPPPVRRDSVQNSPVITQKNSPISSPVSSPIISGKKSMQSSDNLLKKSFSLPPQRSLSLSPMKPLSSSPTGSFLIPGQDNITTARSQVSTVTVETYKDDEGSLKGNDAQVRLLEQKHRMILLTRSINISDNAKGIRYAELIEETFGSTWIRSRHLALLIYFFNYGKLERTEHFGTYNVDIVCALYGRIIDLHNFDIVLSLLDSKEYACVICRLGYYYFYYYYYY